MIWEMLTAFLWGLIGFAICLLAGLLITGVI